MEMNSSTLRKSLFLVTTAN